MARAHLLRPLTDAEGNLLYGATVTVRDADFSVPIAQTLWADPTGTDPVADVLSNPFTATSGVIDIWLDTPQRVSVLIEYSGAQADQVYLDVQPPPEQTVISTDGPMAIVNTPTVPGQVLLSTGTAGQVQWGTAPSGTSLTPVVITSSQSFNSGSDPAGWVFTQSAGAAHSYDASTIPPSTTYLYSMKATQSANSGSFTLTGPTTTLLEAGSLSFWLKASIATGETVKFITTDPSHVQTTQLTITVTRDWGFYSYALPAGTYTPSWTYTGSPTFDGTQSHAVWMTGYVAQYGGNVPPHNHAGSGTNSVQLGTGASATGSQSIAIGASATASATNSTAFGYQAAASGLSALAAGNAAIATTNYAVAIGAGASGSTTATAWLAAGYNAVANGQDAVAVGRGSNAASDFSVAVGSFASAGSSGTGAVAIGQNASAIPTNAVAIGQGATVASTHTNSVALGSTAATTGPSQVMLGAPGSLTVVPGSLQNYGQASLGSAGSRVGFYGAAGQTQQVITGSDDGNTTLRNLIQALASMGLIINNTIQQPAQYASPVGAYDYFLRNDAGDGSLGISTFDFAPYTYVPSAFTNQTTYPSGPNWFVGTDKNGYKGAVDGLGFLKNLYTTRQTFQVNVTSVSGSTNKICLVLHHTGQSDNSAAAAYVILDQAAGTLTYATKAASAMSGTYTVQSGNSPTLSSIGVTPFDGASHQHLVSINGNNMCYMDLASATMVPIKLSDSNVNLTGTFAGLDLNTLTANVNQVLSPPPLSFATFPVTGAITNTTSWGSGDVWTTSYTGTGSGATVNVANNCQVTGAGTGAQALIYTLFPANSLGRWTQFKWGSGTLNTSMGAVGRLQDSSNYYFVNNSQIQKVSGGTASTLTTLSQTFVAGDTCKIIWNANGLIQVFRNGTSIGTATDTTFVSNSRFGFGVRGVFTANFNYLVSQDLYYTSVVYR